MVEINVWVFTLVLVLLTVVPIVAVNVLGNRLYNVSYELGRTHGQLAATRKELRDIETKSSK